MIIACPTVMLGCPCPQTPWHFPPATNPWHVNGCSGQASWDNNDRAGLARNFIVWVGEDPGM